MRSVQEMRTVIYNCDGCNRPIEQGGDETYPREWIKMRAEAQSADGTSLLGTADLCPLCIRQKPLADVQFRWRSVRDHHAVTEKKPLYAEYRQEPAK